VPQLLLVHSSGPQGPGEGSAPLAERLRDELGPEYEVNRGDQDWEAEWALPAGWPDPGADLPRMVFFHSRDDEEIPVAHLERYGERFPKASVHALNGCGHLYEGGDLGEVVDAIDELTVA
jgi:pimeloyl-ACP methyl ester carboxylesterase